MPAGQFGAVQPADSPVRAQPELAGPHHAGRGAGAAYPDLVAGLSGGQHRAPEHLAGNRQVKGDHVVQEHVFGQAWLQASIGLVAAAAVLLGLVVRLAG